MNRDQLISWVELSDAHGDRPFWIVEQIQLWGYSRSEAVEIYRLGTVGWTLTSKRRDHFKDADEAMAE